MFFLFASLEVNAQQQPDKLGTWNIANLNYRLNSKFGLYGELQLRSQKFYDDFFYYEIKAGATYYLPQKNSLFFGLGKYGTYSDSGNFKEPVKTNEFRMWEQFVLNNNLNRVKLEHRYRIEQRWLNGVFAARFRYRLNAVVPLNNKTMKPGTFYIGAFDEVFFTNKAPYFLRNRLYGGAGYQFTSLFTLQMGLLRQFDYRTSDGGTGKNYLQTSLLFNIDKTKHEVIPSTHD